MEAEANLSSRRSIALCLSLGVLLVGLLWWRSFSSSRQLQGASGATINKQPAVFARRTFDPAARPADMPPLAPDEEAECDSNFMSNTSVGGQARQTDATHATVTVTQVKMTLQLNITIWVPEGVTPHVAEHEEGHRQISEHYYQTADTLAERIAAAYLGKQVLITGADLDVEFSKLLKQLGSEITDQYNKGLNPEPAQLRYDSITDRSRNEIVARDAVAQALEETAPASARAQSNSGN